MPDKFLRSSTWNDHKDCDGWLWLSSAGNVALCGNVQECDYHMSASDDAGPQEVLEALERAAKFGFRLLDQDYCEPVILPSGAVQLYLSASSYDLADIETDDDLWLLYDKRDHTHN